MPIGDKIELNLGPDPEVIFELVKLRTWRDTIWMQRPRREHLPAGRSAGRGDRVNSSVAGWDDHTLFAQRVRNYTKKPIDLEIRRTLPGDVVFRSGLPAKNHDYQTVEYTATVTPGRRPNCTYEVVKHQGCNARQNRVLVEAEK